MLAELNKAWRGQPVAAIQEWWFGKKGSKAEPKSDTELETAIENDWEARAMEILASAEQEASLTQSEKLMGLYETHFKDVWSL